MTKTLTELLNLTSKIRNPLPVPLKKSRKKRLHLNLRLVNSYVLHEKVRFDDCKVALDYVKKEKHVDRVLISLTFMGYSRFC